MHTRMPIGRPYRRLEAAALLTQAAVQFPYASTLVVDGRSWSLPRDVAALLAKVRMCARTGRGAAAQADVRRADAPGAALAVELQPVRGHCQRGAQELPEAEVGARAVIAASRKTEG